ncbi:MAG: 50S ribosomal protein L18e [Candidatus Marsarchaeota archaeon]|jgi:large subunit ribosomal protein L18e|nr:50S ribosomal protein L18e [Candidatus Marsarchaeota archaeon]MCL5115015.1 50S ribosomal protein L18e [Candidatus Marsarchaeota archaeon]
MKINAEKPEVKEWLSFASSASGGGKAKIWGRVAELVAVPARSRTAVNIYKINKHTKEGSNVIVPGKVLSAGKMDHKIRIAALEYSKGAAKRLSESGCSMLDLKSMSSQKNISIIV